MKIAVLAIALLAILGAASVEAKAKAYRDIKGFKPESVFDGFYQGVEVTKSKKGDKTQVSTVAVIAPADRGHFYINNYNSVTSNAGKTIKIDERRYPNDYFIPEARDDGSSTDFKCTGTNQGYFLDQNDVFTGIGRCNYFRLMDNGATISVTFTTGQDTKSLKCPDYFISTPEQLKRSKFDGYYSVKIQAKGKTANRFRCH